jgi:hypothetical protein
MGIIENVDERLRLKEMNIPLFSQLLIEEYVRIYKNSSDGIVPVKELKDILNLKYNLLYSIFDQFFSDMITSIPGLVIPGSYSKISIDLEVARRLNLYE